MGELALGPGKLELAGSIRCWRESRGGLLSLRGDRYLKLEVIDATPTGNQVIDAAIYNANLMVHRTAKPLTLGQIGQVPGLANLTAAYLARLHAIGWPQAAPFAQAMM